MILSEVLEIKKTETVIAEKEQELKRGLSRKIEYKGPKSFLNQSDGNTKALRVHFFKVRIMISGQHKIVSIDGGQEKATVVACRQTTSLYCDSIPWQRL